MTIDDVVHSDSVKFQDFDILPHTAEETIHRFAALYRDGAFSNAPFEPITKKYSL